MKDVPEEHRRAEATPADPFESIQEILRIPFHLPEMRVGKDGYPAVDFEGLWEGRHGEILPARVTSGTPLAPHSSRLVSFP